jgi:hypothetical protein
VSLDDRKLQRATEVRLLRSLRSKYQASAKSEPIESFEQLATAGATETDKSLVLIRSYAENLQFSEDDVDALVRSELKHVEQQFAEPATNAPSAEALSKLCTHYPPLVRVDKFARLVALLNWVIQTSGAPLPDLPDFIGPVATNVPQTWREDYARPVNTVLTDPAVSGDAPDSPVHPDPTDTDGHPILWTIGVLLALWIIWTAIRRRRT